MTARLQTREGQAQQEQLQPSFRRPRRDFSAKLQQPSTDLCKLDLRNLSTVFGTRLILFFEQGLKKTPLLLQNYFLQKENLYSGKLFTRKGWKSLIFGPAVYQSSTATLLWSGSSPSFPLFLTLTSPPPSPVVPSPSFHQLCCSFDPPVSWFSSLKWSRKQTNKQTNSIQLFISVCYFIG